MTNNICKPSVMLIHAAVIPKSSLNLLGKRLSALGFTVHNIGYPNRRMNVYDCAEFLKPTLFELAASSSSKIHLVGHSMGGLVARRLLHLYQPPNLGRVVTMGTPHLGSPLADYLHNWGFYKRLFGPAGQDLTTKRPIDWLAPWPPPYDIGLMAGSIPIGPGVFTIPWEGDGTVAHASAQPAGGADYVRVRATHSTIPMIKKTAGLMANFMACGRFLS